MWELLTNAWKGWMEYITGGKFAALLIAALLFLWIFREKAQKQLLYYTSLMTALCIFPVSSAFFMKYQTAFYDYQWIWSLVPVTLTIAFGATVFLTKYWEGYEKRRFNKLFATLFVCAAILLCGSAGAIGWKEQALSEKSENAAKVLKLLDADKEDGEICLWAPREVMEYARAVDGSVKLLYGRNMWDKWLNAYSYDVYKEQHIECYLWMEAACESGELESLAGQEHTNGEKLLSGIDCARAAQGLGVNRILLPENMQKEALLQIEKALGVQARELGGYYLLVLQ